MLFYLYIIYKLSNNIKTKYSHCIPKYIYILNIVKIYFGNYFKSEKVLNIVFVV